MARVAQTKAKRCLSCVATRGSPSDSALTLTFATATNLNAAECPGAIAVEDERFHLQQGRRVAGVAAQRNPGRTITIRMARVAQTKAKRCLSCAATRGSPSDSALTPTFATATSLNAQGACPFGPQPKPRKMGACTRLNSDKSTKRCLSCAATRGLPNAHSRRARLPPLPRLASLKSDRVAWVCVPHRRGPGKLTNPHGEY